MDKRIGTNLVVGIFVLIGFTCFIYVLFNIGGGNGIFTKSYTIYGRFTHLKGLNFGSEVSLMGLRVGTVQQILVDDKSAQKELIAAFNIDAMHKDKIRQDSLATIKTSGVLGDKYIEISIGSPEFPPLKNGEYIKTEQPLDIFSKTGGLMEEIARRFNKGNDIDQMLKNLNLLSANLAAMSSEVQKEKGLWSEVVRGTSGAKLNKSMAHLESILGKIDRGEGTLGGLINDPTVYEDLKSMLSGAKRSTVLKYFMRQFIDSGAPPPEPQKK